MYDDVPQVTETPYEPGDELQTVLDVYHTLGRYSDTDESEERELPNGTDATVIENTVRIGTNLTSLELIEHAFGMTAIIEGAYEVGIGELLDLAVAIGEPTAIYADRPAEALDIGEYVVMEVEFRSSEWEDKFEELFDGLEQHFGSERELPAHDELKDGVTGMTEEVWDATRSEEVEHGPIELQVIERDALDGVTSNGSERA